MANTIAFYSTRGDYGFLSNFASAPFNAPIGQDNELPVRWKTSEHYFQAMKSNDLDTRERIRNATTASEAARLGRDRNVTALRADWDERVDNEEANRIARILNVPFLTTKDMVMLRALDLKFDQNKHLAVKLRNTAPRLLVENAPNDSYWGIGSGGGRNMLGKLLVYVRDNTLPPDSTHIEQFDTMFDNLYKVLTEQGYERITSIAGNPVNLSLSDPTQLPRDPNMNIRDMMISGFDAAREVRGRQIERMPKTGIVDVFLKDNYPEQRLREVVDRYKNVEPKPRYFIVGQVSKGNLQKIITRLASYNNITFYSPAELAIIPSENQLSPPIELLPPSDPRYNGSVGSRLAEISVNDPLIREKGFTRGDIIIVNDFSPHERLIV